MAAAGRKAALVMPDEVLLRALDAREGMSDDEVARLLAEHGD